MKQISLTVNGKVVAAEVEPRTSLADFLRNHQRLTGAHLGCEHGVCGACTILIDGAPARSCIAFAVACDGADIRTVEGFEEDPVMEAVRRAFNQEHALQCGFCTPGMLVTARDIVTRLAAPDEKRIRTELAGNLCRCTGYMGIVNAIQRVVREMPAETRLAGRTATVAATTPSRVAATMNALAPASAPVVATTSAVASVVEPIAAEGAPEKGWSRLTDSFTVDMQPMETWRLFADVGRLARCMPGAELTESDGHNLKGQVRVAFGPIKASFAGTATIERDDARMEGVLRGGGSDSRSGSRAKGAVRYRLVPIEGGAKTRVELVLDYQLQGALAQFGRSGLVKDFASRLIAEFARNLAAFLPNRAGAAGAVQPEPPRAAEFKAGSMIWQVVWARIRSWLGLS